MQLPPSVILDPSALPFTPCALPSTHHATRHLISPPPAPSCPINKKRLRAMRLFPLCLQFRKPNNFESAICRIRLRGIRRRFRELTLIKEQNDEVARVVSNIADRAKALFRNISLLVHSINIREDTQIYDLSQPRKRKRDVG
jgi:hypothetical protein